MKCNICQAIMEVEAVVVDCGHAFCRNCFSKTMADSCPVCPHCDTPLGDDNYHMRQVMPDTAALRGVRPERAIAMFGEALTFWDNQRGLEAFAQHDQEWNKHDNQSQLRMNLNTTRSYM